MAGYWIFRTKKADEADHDLVMLQVLDWVRTDRRRPWRGQRADLQRNPCDGGTSWMPHLEGVRPNTHWGRALCLLILLLFLLLPFLYAFFFFFLMFFVLLFIFFFFLSLFYLDHFILFVLALLPFWLLVDEMTSSKIDLVEVSFLFSTSLEWTFDAEASA